MQQQRTRTVEIAPRITVDPQVRFGKPVIKGTRVPVTVILDELAAGATLEDIMREYGVTREDLRAVFRYVAGIIAEEDIQVARK